MLFIRKRWFFYILNFIYKPNIFARNRRYPAETITGTDYTDDLALLANTQARVESLVHNREKIAGGNDVHVNLIRTESMSLKGDWSIATLNSRPLKLLDKSST